MQLLSYVGYKEPLKLQNVRVTKTTQLLVTKTFKKVWCHTEYLLSPDRWVSKRTQANIDVSNSYRVWDQY